MIEALDPHPNALPEEKAESYELMEDYLIHKRKEAFGTVTDLGRIEGFCLIHKRTCGVFDTSGNQPLTRDLRASDSVESISSSGSSNGIDLEENVMGMARDIMARLIVMEFGSPCVDWSMRGGQQRHTGRSTKVFLIAIAQVLEVQPDFWFHEITDTGTHDLLNGMRMLADAGYAYFQLSLDPPKQGKPMKRPRFHTFAYKQ
jgi:hypothetical protein